MLTTLDAVSDPLHMLTARMPTVVDCRQCSLLVTATGVFQHHSRPRPLFPPASATCHLTMSPALGAGGGRPAVQPPAASACHLLRARAGRAAAARSAPLLPTLARRGHRFTTTTSRHSGAPTCSGYMSCLTHMPGTSWMRDLMIVIVTFIKALYTRSSEGAAGQHSPQANCTAPNSTCTVHSSVHQPWPLATDTHGMRRRGLVSPGPPPA